LELVAQRPELEDRAVGGVGGAGGILRGSHWAIASAHGVQTTAPLPGTGGGGVTDRQ
jgi:hypothetical protein